MVADMMSIVPIRTWIFWLFILLIIIVILGFIGYYNLRKDHQRMMALVLTLGRKNDTN